ncbi:Cytoplasmic membrane, partial [Olea europaea subsp. europaea]
MLKGLSTRLSKYIGFGSGQWVRKRIVDPFLQILRRGAEPKQLAFSGAVGITLGVFPIC